MNSQLSEQHPFRVVRDYLLSQPLMVGALLFCWLFIVYAEIPLAVGAGVSLPCIYLLLLIPVLWPFMLQSVRLSHIYLVAGLLMVGVISIVTKADIGLMGASAFKLLQFGFSAFVCAASVALFAQMGRDMVLRILGIFLVTIVIGCLLERLGLIRPLTEAFRVVYSETKGGGEIDAEREIELAGFARPYFFTAEPSLVGLGYFSIASCYSFINRRIRYDLLVLFGVVIMLSLLGSPTVLLTIVPVGIFMLTKYRITLTQILFVLGVTLVLLLLLLRIPAIYDAVERVFLRIGTEILVENSSMYGRIYVPYFITLPKVVPAYPLFGVGLGNFGYINILFGYNADYYELDSLFIHGSNGFATMIAYLGILGTLMIYLMIMWFHKSMGIPYWWVTILFMIVSGQITGSVSTPRFWAFTGIAMACIWLGTKQGSSNEAG